MQCSNWKLWIKGFTQRSIRISRNPNREDKPCVNQHLMPGRPVHMCVSEKNSRYVRGDTSKILSVLWKISKITIKVNANIMWSLFAHLGFLLSHFSFLPVWITEAYGSCFSHCSRKFSCAPPSPAAAQVSPTLLSSSLSLVWMDHLILFCLSIGQTHIHKVQKNIPQQPPLNPHFLPHLPVDIWKNKVIYQDLFSDLNPQHNLTTQMLWILTAKSLSWLSHFTCVMWNLCILNLKLLLG